MYLNLSSNCIKGIHNETKITREEFLKCLYENKPIDKEQTRLRRDLTKFKFCVVKEQKKALINTSFNVHEEPIVCTPDDAVRAFKTSKLDYLYIEDYIIYK